MSLGPSPILLPDLASYSAVTKFATKQFSRTSEIGKFSVFPNMEYWALITLADTSQSIVSQIWGVGYPLTPFSRFLSTAWQKIRVSSTNPEKFSGVTGSNLVPQPRRAPLPEKYSVPAAGCQRDARAHAGSLTS